MVTFNRRIHPCEGPSTSADRVPRVYPADYNVQGRLSPLAMAGELAAVFGLPPPGDLLIPALPKEAGMERIIAIPHWSLVGADYGQAFLRAVAVMKERYPDFAHYCDVGTSDPVEDPANSFDPRRLKLIKKTAASLDMQRRGNFVVMPIQSGLARCGCSTRYAESKLGLCEFALDPFTVVCQLIVEPERLMEDPRTLWISCAGALYDHPDSAVGYIAAHFGRDNPQGARASRMFLMWCDEDAVDEQNSIPTGYVTR